MATSNKLKLATVLITASAFLYKFLTQRSPLYFLNRPPALTNPHACAVHFPETLHNCEDFSQLPDTTLLFLSCDRSRREWYHPFGAFPPSAPKGEVFLWDYTSPETPPVLLSGAESLGVDFHPLGISAVRTKDEGIVRLFVTNQAKKAPRIEVLDINLANKTSRHKRSLTDAKIFSPNGIAAIDEDSFYITNDGFFSRRWSTALLFEVMLGVPGGQVVHVSVNSPDSQDPVHAYSVAWVSLANGLALDKAAQKLHVASSTHGVYTYAIPDMSAPHRAMFEKFHRTPFAADNLYLSSSGRLFVSGLYSFSEFYASLLADGGRSPSAWTVALVGDIEAGDRVEVAKRGLDPANSPLRREEWVWRSVFLDDGTFFGGVSTAGVVDASGRFVGVSVVGRGVLVCDRVIDRPGVLKKEEVKEEL